MLSVTSSDLTSARIATPDECAAFGIESLPINWAVVLRDEIAAIYQAENDGDGWLAVHAHVKPRTLHPLLSAAYAKTFSDQLLQHGASGLVAEIPPQHRAALRMARAAGFAEVCRNDEWVTLKRDR